MSRNGLVSAVYTGLAPFFQTLEPLAPSHLEAVPEISSQGSWQVKIEEKSYNFLTQVLALVVCGFSSLRDIQKGMNSRTYLADSGTKPETYRSDLSQQFESRKWTQSNPQVNEEDLQSTPKVPPGYIESVQSTSHCVPRVPLMCPKSIPRVLPKIQQDTLKVTPEYPQYSQEIPKKVPRVPLKWP